MKPLGSFVTQTSSLQKMSNMNNAMDLRAQSGYEKPKTNLSLVTGSNSWQNLNQKSNNEYQISYQ